MKKAKRKCRRLLTRKERVECLEVIFKEIIRREKLGFKCNEIKVWELGVIE